MIENRLAIQREAHDRALMERDAAHTAQLDRARMMLIPDDPQVVIASRALECIT